MIVGSVYAFVSNQTIGGFITDKFKSGYWFTFSLFEFLLVQYLYERLAAIMRCRTRDLTYAIGLVVLSLSLYAISIPVVSDRFGRFGGLVGLPLLRYYLYFAVGRMVRLHLADISHWGHKECAMALLVAFFASLGILNWCSPTANLRGVAFHCNLVAFELSALLLVFAAFCRSRSYWSADKTLPRALSFLGRRTLDIYLLHYFFLPADLHVFGTYFQTHPAPVVEALFSLLVSLSVIGGSLLCSALLRSSRIVAKYVLGEK